MGLPSQAIVSVEKILIGQVDQSPRRREKGEPRRGWERILAEPRNGVLITLFGILLIGGGRKLLQAWNARRAVVRLGEADATAQEIEDTARYGRAGLMELFRLLGTAESEPIRRAAGHALSVLWAQDNLIAEEEKALVLRGYLVNWRARRRYPRALKSPIPFHLTYEIPFLRSGGAGIAPERLEWSYRILGAKRAGLEEFTPWKAGNGTAEFSLYPGDFDLNGPHKLVFHARVRTCDLTDSWELDLPQIPFVFEFDPILAVDSLLALADSTRAEAIAKAVRLEGPHGGDSDGSTFLSLNDQMSLRNPPDLVVTLPLPCDLAHAIELEFEGIPGRFRAGEMILSGQGESRSLSGLNRSPIVGPIAPLPLNAIERPGLQRIRAILSPNPDDGWADPDVRSIWPGVIETGWIETEIVRR